MLYTAVITAILIAMLTGAPAATEKTVATSNCAARERVEKRLSDNYKEHPLWTGLSKEGYVAQIWTRKDGKTWTLLHHMADGRICVIDWGENNFLIIDPAPPEGDPT